MRTFSKIETLKNKARRYYANYHYELDQMECGKAIGELMNPRAAEAKIKFNQTLDELAKLDPNCPKGRL